MTRKALVFLAVAMLILTGEVVSQEVAGSAEPDPAAPGAASNAEIAMLELRLERALSKRIEAIDSRIDSKVATELNAHRTYLQQLDDRFYERFIFWLPIVSSLIALLFAVFLWQVGSTRREAFESAQAMAVAKASELAQAKVAEIIIPEDILRDIKATSDSLVDGVRNLKSTLLEEVERELREVKDEIVQNKHEIIEETLDHAIKTKFEDEFDIMKRLAKLEERAFENEQRLKLVRKRINVEAVTQAVAQDLADLTPFSRSIVAALQGIARLLA